MEGGFTDLSGGNWTTDVHASGKCFNHWAAGEKGMMLLNCIRAGVGGKYHSSYKSHSPYCSWRRGREMKQGANSSREIGFGKLKARAYLPAGCQIWSFCSSPQHFPSLCWTPACPASNLQWAGSWHTSRCRSPTGEQGHSLPPAEPLGTTRFLHAAAPPAKAESLFVI